MAKSHNDRPVGDRHHDDEAPAADGRASLVDRDLILHAGYCTQASVGLPEDAEQMAHWLAELCPRGR
jgi:hypothetical protein